MKVGVVKETFPGERRVALVPDIIGPLAKRGFEVLIEAGAGTLSGYADAAYEAKGAKVLGSRKEVFDGADIIAQVRLCGANPDCCGSDLDLLHDGQILVGAADPLSRPDLVADLAKKNVNAFGLELIPRTTRAQSMDILSSMALVAGYRAVLWAAQRLPKFFPMFMTAAGTVAPAKVFIIGAGVAGLQAIATAKRLGAIVSAYDIRSAVKEEVESLGGKFVEMELETGGAEDKGGYAKRHGRRVPTASQRELMTKVVAADCHIVITTAADPRQEIAGHRDGRHGQRHGMPGSVIVDLAAERGGNCELTKLDEDRRGENDVTILGPSESCRALPAVPRISQMYSPRTCTNFLVKMLSKHRERMDALDHRAWKMKPTPARWMTT